MSVPLLLRSATSNYVVFSIILVPIFVLYLVLIFLSTTMWPGLLASGSLLALALGWVASVRLIVTDDRIVYRDWLSSRDVALADIGDARTASGLAFDKRGRLLPFRRLILEPRDSRSGKPIYINLATFSPRDVNQLLKRLNSR